MFHNPRTQTMHSFKTCVISKHWSEIQLHKCLNKLLMYYVLHKQNNINIALICPLDSYQMIRIAMSKHTHGHLLVFIALIWTKPLEGASIQIIPPLNDVRDCSKPADAKISFSAGIAIAQKVRLITDGVLAVAGVSTGPLGGLVLNTAQFVMNFKQSEDEMSLLATCISNQIQQKMNQYGYEDLTNIVDGFQSNLERNVMRDLERHNVTKENCVEENCYHIDFKAMSIYEQLEIWTDLELVVNSMDILAAKFKGSRHDYSAGYYYALPYFASKHLEAMVLQIDLSNKLEKIDKSKQTGYLKQDFGGFIRYYSEICLRFWRIARDKFCQNQDWTAECVSQPAPYHLFLKEWANLAEKFDQHQVKDYILQSLSRNRIVTGEWVAFKSIKIAKDHLKSEKSVSSQDNSVWFSCTSKRSYCYLRDCPGQYFSTTDCHGEKFKIHKGSGDSIVRSRDKVGIRSSNGNWLSMYDHLRCKCTGHEDSHAWWTTRACPGEGSNWPPQEDDVTSSVSAGLDYILNRSDGCEDEVHYIINVRDDDNEEGASTLENGDFVNIKWKGNCDSWRGHQQPRTIWRSNWRDGRGRCNSRYFNDDAILFGGPFEIVKVDYETDIMTETNNWNSVPRLPSRQNR